MALQIGTAGIPQSAAERSTEAGIERLQELGLGCMELEFVRSVQMQKPRAEKVKQAAAAAGIELTVHAPYYINLNSREKDKVRASRERILQAARIGWAAGARSITFHAAFYHDDDHDDVYRTVCRELDDLRTALTDEGTALDLRPETTGSPAQFGTVAEILRLSQEIPGIYPCVDFSHLHARSGGRCNTYEAFAQVLDTIQKALGPASLRRLHMHVSGIEYGPKGEKKHLPFAEADFDYRALLACLWDYDVGGWLICESPILEADALLLLETYTQIQNQQP